MRSSLSHIDINLLLSLQALLEEKNVSRAAQRLCITQPAMSRKLARLRDLFDDQLLYRAGNRLVSTPKALGLREPLLHTLDSLEDLVGTQPFDPALAEGTVRILYPDLTATDLLIALVRKVQRIAPGLDIELQNHVNVYIASIDERQLLRMGTVDFSISYEVSTDPDFPSTPLDSAVPLCWMRREHPLAMKKSITLKDIFSYSRVAFYMSDYGEWMMDSINQSASNLGLTPAPTFRTSSLMMAMEMICNSDTITISSQTLGELSLTHNKIISMAIPNGIPLLKQTNTQYLIQHSRTVNSPVHKWIGKELLQISEQIHPAIERDTS